MRRPVARSTRTPLFLTNVSAWISRSSSSKSFQRWCRLAKCLDTCCCRATALWSIGSFQGLDAQSSEFIRSFKLKHEHQAHPCGSREFYIVAAHHHNPHISCERLVRYIRVIGIALESNASGRVQGRFSADEVEEMHQMSKDPEIFDRICNSIAPSIWGNEDIKKAVACLLFSGSAKKLADGTRLRGDINVLVLGDPGTAKSQVLKFVEKVLLLCTLVYERRD